MSDHEPTLVRLGARVRRRRHDLGMTLKQLAASSGVSSRYLVELESGRGNISVGRLAQLARALDLDVVELLSRRARVGRLAARAATLDASALVRIEALLEELEGAEGQGRRLIALLGVRGAGKSSVGAGLARRLGVDLIELDQLVEEVAGVELDQVFSIHGEDYYRQVEHDVLTRLLAAGGDGVLATGGSLVTHPETWSVLRRHAVTVWLRATARDHWERVIAQGDRRPMRENPHAFAQLEALLRTRRALYEQSDFHVDTSGRQLEAVVEDVLRAVADLGVTPAVPAAHLPGEPEVGWPHG